MCHLTEMKHNTIHVLHLTKLTTQNTSLTTVNAYLKRMELTKLIKHLTTNLCIIEHVILYKITLGQLTILL